MFKKHLFFAAMVLAKCGLGAFEISNYFYIDTPSTYMVGDAIMNIRTEEKTLGLIKRNISESIWSQRIPQYDLYNAKDGLEAIAKLDATDQKYRVVFSVEDKNNQPLGRIEENWENNYFFYNPTFKIYSANGELLAIGQGNLNRTVLTLIDPLDDHVLVSFVSKGLFVLDNWNVVTEDPQFIKRIDSRLLSLGLAISTDKAFHYNLSGYQPSSISVTSAFQAKLQPYEGQFKEIKPTEEDDLFARALIDSVLITSHEKIELQTDPLEKGFKILMPLLDNQELTIKQKSALLLLMKQRLEQ